LAILRLVEMEKAVVEGAGAIGLAAVLGDYVPELKGKKYANDRLIIISALCQRCCLFNSRRPTLVYQP